MAAALLCYKTLALILALVIEGTSLPLFNQQLAGSLPPLALFTHHPALPSGEWDSSAIPLPLPYKPDDRRISETVIKDKEFFRISPNGGVKLPWCVV